MSISQNADMKVNSSGQNLDNDTVSGAEINKPNSSVETPNPINESTQKTSEVNLKSEKSHLVHKFSKLNPMAKEFIPTSLARTHSGVLSNRFCSTNNFAMEAISVEEHGHFDTRIRNFGQENQNRQINLDQDEDVIKRTVYVSNIDPQVTEDQLADLFLSCGQIVDCRVCSDNKYILRFAFIEFTDEVGAKSALRKSGTMVGFHPLKVLLSKTAIMPINPNFLPRSEEERAKCSKTVYCTNIDKMITKMELVDFFKTACGEIHHLMLLGEYHHQTNIAFVEFKLGESAISALSCSGVVLGRLRIRVCPSKTPLRPHRSDLN